MSVCVQELYESAAVEAAESHQGVPPSYAKLVAMIDSAFPNGYTAEPSSTAARHELYQAASAAQWAATYNLLEAPDCDKVSEKLHPIRKIVSHPVCMHVRLTYCSLSAQTATLHLLALH